MCKLYQFFNRLGFIFAIIAALAMPIFGLCVTASAAPSDLYSYNGFEFPELPEVSFSPSYFVLVNDFWGNTDYLLYATPVPLRLLESGGSLYYPDLISFSYAIYYVVDGVWDVYRLDEVSTSAPFHFNFDTCLWSSYNIYRGNEPPSSSTLFLPGSDPVSVDGPDVESSIVSVSVSSLTSAAYPGSTVHFDAAVSGTGSYDSSVTWSVSGAASADTSIDNSGNLSIADNETAAQLTVTATSVQDISVSGSASIVVQPFPNVDDLTIVPGKETALQGVAFVQQFSLAYKDGSAYTGPPPVWSFEVTPPDSPFPDLDGEYSWVTISDTGILSISADAPADYMVVLTAKLGDQYLTGGRVFISTETNDYLKDIINGTEEQKGQVDSFGDKTDEQFADLEEDVSLIDQVTMPNIDDIDLNIDTQVSGDGMTALAMLLGLFMNSQVISTSMTFAFLFALVAFVIFGKR